MCHGLSPFDTRGGSDCTSSFHSCLVSCSTSRELLSSLSIGQNEKRQPPAITGLTACCSRFILFEAGHWICPLSGGYGASLSESGAATSYGDIMKKHKRLVKVTQQDRELDKLHHAQDLRLSSVENLCMVPKLARGISCPRWRTGIGFCLLRIRSATCPGVHTDAKAAS